VNAFLRLAAPGLVATTLVLAPTSALAVSFSYCDFSSTTGLSINGNASRQGNVLRLTPDALWQQGSAFTTTQLPFDATTSFHTFFRFHISANPGGADGLAFVLQSGGAGAIGSAGYGLGYLGIGSSFAVEFDTYRNDVWDPDANHVGVLLDGDVMKHVASATPGFVLANDKDRYVWIDYDAPQQVLEVYVAEDPVKPVKPLVATAIDLDAHLGPLVRAGFTSATGGLSNMHQILEWQMSTDGIPCCEAAPNGACGDDHPVCVANAASATGGLCVECLDDSDCGPSLPHCETGSSTCVACLSNADCSAGAPVCVANACAPCAGDVDCAENAASPACAPTGACVACTSDETCAAPLPKCDTSAFACVACLSSADCAALTPECEPVTHTCVECFEDSVCPTATPVCDTGAHQCVAGCHVVAGKDSCAPDRMCDAQDGSIGQCQSIGTSSSGMASSSSSSGGSGGAMMGSGGAGGAATSSSGGAMGGAGGSGGSSTGGGTGSTSKTPVEAAGGCGCRAGAEGGRGAGLAAALVIAALGSRRRRRSTR
jgi:MYXO-CTERM domain-containing protein